MDPLSKAIVFIEWCLVALQLICVCVNFGPFSISLFLITLTTAIIVTQSAKNAFRS